MAESASVASSSPAETPPVPSCLLSSPSQVTENRQEVGEVIADLDKSQSELISRLRGLKQEMQNWRSKLDTQVKIYQNEISELKTSLTTEMEQLKTGFEELKVTLQEEQMAVTSSLKALETRDETKYPRKLETESTEKVEDHIVCNPTSEDAAN